MSFRISTISQEESKLNNYKEKSFYIFRDPGEYKILIPPNTMEIMVSVIGGGGAGASGFVENNIVYAGGGGGGGGNILCTPFNIEKYPGILNTSLLIYVGKGGKNAGADGEDSYVKSTTSNFHLISSGGKCAIKNKGGENGVGFIFAQKGYDGGSSLPSMPSPVGGNGGNSCFGLGGKGSSLVGKDGDTGAGGGGSGVGISKVGKGGDGFVYVHFIFNNKVHET